MYPICSLGTTCYRIAMSVAKYEIVSVLKYYERSLPSKKPQLHRFSAMSFVDDSSVSQCQKLDMPDAFLGEASLGPYPLLMASKEGWRLSACLCHSSNSLSALAEVGWRAEFLPADHALSDFEFDVIVGADGNRNTLEGEDSSLEAER